MKRFANVALFILILCVPSLAFAQANVSVCTDIPSFGASCTLVSADNPLPVEGTISGTISGLIIAPTASASAAIAPISSSVAESSHVLKASAGNLYGLHVSTAAASGYVMVFDATSAPGDGTVAPAMCMAIPVNSTLGISPGSNVPIAFATGITVVFSTTGCFTKTASATAFISGYVK